MTKIKCSKCNEEIENSARFCPNCGKKIGKSEEKPDQKVKMIIFAFIVIVSIGIVVTALIYKNRDDVVNEVVVAESNQRDENKKQIEVIADFINIRKSRNINSEKLGKVRKGDIYTIISEENETSYKWVEIRTSNNIHGYIAGTSEYVKRLNITEDKKEEVQKPSNNNNNKNTNNTNKNNKNNKQPKTDDNKSNSADNSKSEGSINQNENVKTCEKTCEEGNILKNPDSVECYCKPENSAAIAQEKLIVALKNAGFTCNDIKCIFVKTNYFKGKIFESYSYVIDFNSKKIRSIYLNNIDVGGFEVDYNYEYNEATGKWFDVSGKYNTTCSQIYPFYICNPDNTKASKVVNDTVSIFKKHLKSAGISVHDLVTFK